MYFIFIFISPSVPRSSVKMSVNQLVKNKRPYTHDTTFTHLNSIRSIPITGTTTIPESTKHILSLARYPFTPGLNECTPCD